MIVIKAVSNPEDIAVGIISYKVPRLDGTQPTFTYKIVQHYTKSYTPIILSPIVYAEDNVELIDHGGEQFQGSTKL